MPEIKCPNPSIDVCTKHCGYHTGTTCSLVAIAKALTIIARQGGAGDGTKQSTGSTNTTTRGKAYSK